MAAVEVVIPYFQRRPGVLSKALKSVFRQGLEDLQVIVVEDGSPHPADTDIDALDAAQSAQITLIRQSNKGAGGARNTGLDVISDDAKYVAFLDSDDVWADDHLQRSIGTLHALDADIYWDAVEDNPDFAESYAPPTRVMLKNHFEPSPVDGDESAVRVASLARVLCGQWFRHMHLSCTVVRADVAKRIRFDADLPLCEDFDFFRQCAQAAGNAASSDAFGVVRGEGDNLWHGASTADQKYAVEKYSMMRVLKRLSRDPDLIAADLATLQRRIAGCRERFYWGQRDRLRQGRLPNLSLWLKWFVRDPSITALAISLLFKFNPNRGRTTIPGDDL